MTVRLISSAPHASPRAARVAPTRARRLVTLVGACLLLGACASSPDVRFFTLRPVDAPPPTEASASDASIVVAPIEVPKALDRPQLVSLVGEQELFIDDFARWGEPLPGMLTRLLADDLARLLGTSRVVVVDSPSPRIESSYTRVAIVVTRLDAVPGSHLLFEARGAVTHAEGGKAPFAFAREIPWSDARPLGLVTALQRALDELAQQVADAVRSTTGSTTLGG